MKQLKKTILTLVALLAVTTGAWADEITVTWSSGDTYENNNSKDGVTLSGDIVRLYGSEWQLAYDEEKGTFTTELGNFTNIEITGGYISGFSGEGWSGRTWTGNAAAVPFNGYMTDRYGGDPWTITFTIEPASSAYDPSAASAVDVDWNKTSKTGTFDMPGGNVELEPEYYPQATAAEGAVTEATDVKATTDAPLVTIDETKLTGAAKMMYYVSTDATAPAYDAEGWTDELPTAEKFTEAGNVNVWYYPVGTDENVGGATATYSDGDMNATALTVTIAAAPTYAVTFNAANANTIEAGKATVTVGGTDKTSAITEGKLEGVKMGSEVKVTAKEGYKFRKVEVKKGAADVKITSFSIHTSSNYVYSAGTFTCSIIDILPANATNQTFEWNINSGAPVGTTIKTVSDDTKTVTILAGAVSGSITIEATAKDGGGANKLMHITVME